MASCGSNVALKWFEHGSFLTAFLPCSTQDQPVCHGGVCCVCKADGTIAMEEFKGSGVRSAGGSNATVNSSNTGVALSLRELKARH